MSRTRKLIAVGTVTLGIVAATSGPALANRHTATPPSEHRLAMSVEENRHISVEPTENRHES